MKVPKSMIQRIVREELTSYLGEMLSEDDANVAKDDEEDEQKPGAPKKPPAKKGPPSTSTGEEDNVDGTPAGSQGPEKAPKKGADATKDLGDEPTPGSEEEDPADDDLAKDAEDPEDETDAKGGGIADDVSGKRIQSIVLSKDSKVMPGAQELVISFDEIPDPLRVVITKSGLVKYFFRGTISNSL